MQKLANVQRSVATVGITTENETCFLPVKNEASHWECRIECEGIFISKHHRERCQNSVGFFCQVRGRSSVFYKGFRMGEWDQEGGSRERMGTSTSLGKGPRSGGNGVKP